ncbi:serine/threonine-protein kinase [Arthrobacter sp. NamB2]|uniref:serine/threonine-protein kinase n=1 Tax=Arthrobacter sp. NamB2 TaxID=2576035 RepID=UPI0016719998|nr:serine/threonine-protein kinase [Arthrobacter sp. NamB2]
MIPEGYELTSKVHEGSSAQVWRAKNPSGETVVLKLAASDSHSERRFKREIEGTRDAAGHHVIPLLDFDDTASWYSMPAAAKTLYQEKDTLPASFDESLRVLEAITAALRPLHLAGQVHRDLKPQNILWLVDEKGARWVVADFGIVRNPAGLTRTRLTADGGLTGSDGWAAPEQYQDGHKTTAASDVYAAGAIVSWMLTGVHPTFGYVEYPPASQLSAILKRATAPKPTNRYPNLDVLLEAVKVSAAASTTSLSSLLETGNWPQVSAYVSQANRRNQVVNALPKLDQSRVDAWFEADRPGLVMGVSDALDNLREDHSGLDMKSQVDPLLSWVVRVLRVLVNNGEHEDATHVATALFHATAWMDQYTPATAILDWLDNLNGQAQRAMEVALHNSTDTWAFFKSMASGRWPSKSRSELLQRLQE